jgi:hypothetical protein
MHQQLWGYKVEEELHLGFAKESIEYHWYRAYCNVLVTLV